MANRGDGLLVGGQVARLGEDRSETEHWIERSANEVVALLPFLDESVVERHRCFDELAERPEKAMLAKALERELGEQVQVAESRQLIDAVGRCVLLDEVDLLGRKDIAEFS